MQQALPVPSSATTDVAQRITEQVMRRIGSHRFEMWFGATTMLVQGHRLLRVITDSQFVAQWIDNHFRKDLLIAAREVLMDDAEVDVTVAPTAQTQPAAAVSHENVEPIPFPANITSPQRPNGHSAATATKAAGNRTRRRGVSLRRLEDFVVGASNRLAYSAARAITEDQNAKIVSPLFIHGECGVGKTHLLQAVCQRVAETHGSSGVRYVTGEQFTNEFIASVRNQTIDAFRTRVRKLDVLAIDDVQFLSNKTATQSEFMHTIDAIGQLGARIVLASNDHPRLIKKFPNNLVSRLLSGMVVQIDPPDRETRLRLIHTIASTRNLRVLDAAAESLASRCVGSVRELEGAITKLGALASLAGETSTTSKTGEIGLLLVERLFSEQAWRPAAPVRIGAIIDAVCSRLNINRGDLIGSGRHSRVVLARALVAYLGRELTTLSYPEIAQAMGRRHHSTVHTAAQRLARQLAENHRIVIAPGEAPTALTAVLDQIRHDLNRGGRE